MSNYNQSKLLIIGNWINQTIKNQFGLGIGSNLEIGAAKRYINLKSRITALGRENLLKYINRNHGSPHLRSLKERKEKEILSYKLNFQITAFLTYQSEQCLLI